MVCDIVSTSPRERSREKKELGWRCWSNDVKYQTLALDEALCNYLNSFNSFDPNECDDFLPRCRKGVHWEVEGLPESLHCPNLGCIGEWGGGVDDH